MTTFNQTYWFLIEVVWERWIDLMKYLFEAQEVFEIVRNGCEKLGSEPTDAEKATFKESKKKDCIALFYIQHNIDAHQFENISKVTRSKEA